MAIAAALSFCVEAVAQEELFAFPDLVAVEGLELEADELTWNRRSRVLRASGGVTLLLDHRLTLRSPRLTVDLRTRRAVAEGGVTLTEGPRMLLAERLELSLDGHDAVAFDAVLVLREAGRRRMYLAAARIAQVGRHRFEADDVEFTACDCGPGNSPSWTLTASSATVTSGEGAWLFLPVLRVHGVPVLPLPILYVPLGDRRTGLLMPEYSWSSRRGLRLSQPMYFALGRSYDATLQLGGYSGLTPEGVRAGVRGFEAVGEFRYRPTRRTTGTLETKFVFDTQPQTRPSGAQIRGPRALVSWKHHSRFLATALNLATDAALVGDLAARLEQREVGYLRSAARLHLTPHRLVSAELGMLYLQDLRRATITAGGETFKRPLFSHLGPLTFQRLPELHLSTAPVSLFGGAYARAALDATQWALMPSSFRDAGTDGLVRGDLGWVAPDPDGTEEDGVLGGADQSPVLHGGAQAEVALPFHLGEIVVGRLHAGGRADTWRHQAAGGRDAVSAMRLYPIFGGRVGTALRRRYGALEHRIEPSVGWRWVPTGIASGPRPSLGAEDLTLAEDLALHQLVVAVDTDLRVKGAPRFSARLAQAVDLRAGVGESYAEVRLAAGRQRVRARLAWDWDRARVSAASTAASVRAWGAVGTVRWSYVDVAASAWTRAGLDELFAAGAVGPAPFSRPVNELTLSLRGPPVAGLTGTYQLRADLGPREFARLPQHVVSLAYDSPCECWSTSITAVWPPGQNVPNFVFALQLAEIGGVRNVRAR